MSGISAQQIIEHQESQNGPQGKNQIGLCGKGRNRNNIRHQEFQRKQQRNQKSETAGDHDAAVLFLFRRTIRSDGRERIGDGSTDGCDIYDPADCGSAEKRKQDREAENQKDGFAGNTVRIQFSPGLRQQGILGHGMNQTAESDVIADQTGEDSTQCGNAKQGRPECTKGMVGSEERRLGGNPGKLVEACDIVHPAGTAFRKSRCRKER